MMNYQFLMIFIFHIRPVSHRGNQKTRFIFIPVFLLSGCIALNFLAEFLETFQKTIRKLNLNFLERDIFLDFFVLSLDLVLNVG